MGYLAKQVLIEESFYWVGTKWSCHGLSCGGNSFLWHWAHVLFFCMSCGQSEVPLLPSWLQNFGIWGFFTFQLSFTNSLISFILIWIVFKMCIFWILLFILHTFSVLVLGLYLIVIIIIAGVVNEAGYDWNCVSDTVVWNWAGISWLVYDFVSPSPPFSASWPCSVWLFQGKMWKHTINHQMKCFLR